MRTATTLLLSVLLSLLLMACEMPTDSTADDSMPNDMADGEMTMDAPEMTPGELTVANVRANLTLPTDTGSVWLFIMNGTDEDDALIGAEIPGCGVVELHDMKMENDVMTMFPVEGQRIPIPAGETVALKKGGLHIMCLNKEAPVELGTPIEMVLEFENAGEVTVTGEVVEPGASMPMSQGNGEMGGDMDEDMGTEGMDAESMEGEESDSETD